MAGKDVARQIEKYMRAKYRVPETTIRQLRVAYADRAVTDGQDVKMNRIYSIVALALARYTEEQGDKWGEKRLTRFLYYFSDVYEEFYKSGDTWSELMEKLSSETGLIIRTGEEGDEIIEYQEEGEKDGAI